MRGLLVYTGLRLALLAAVWLVVQLVTPWRGLLAIAVALAVSGVIGFFLLDRTRDAASASVWRVFRRIDDRIQRNALAEDALVDATFGVDGPPGAAGGTEVLSAGRDAQANAQQQAVGTTEQSGEGEHRDEVSAGHTVEHDEADPHGQG